MLHSPIVWWVGHRLAESGQKLDTLPLSSIPGSRNGPKTTRPAIEKPDQTDRSEAQQSDQPEAQQTDQPEALASFIVDFKDLCDTWPTRWGRVEPLLVEGDRTKLGERLQGGLKRDCSPVLGHAGPQTRMIA